MQISSGSGQVSYPYYTDNSGTATVKTTTTTENQTPSSGTTGESPAAVYEPSTSSPDMSFIYTKPLVSAQAVVGETVMAEELGDPTDTQAIYVQWLEDLEAGIEQYSVSLYQTIDESASFFTEDDKISIRDGIDAWFQSKRSDLESLLTATDEVSKAALLQTADDELAIRKQVFHEQVGARIEFVVWNETLVHQATTINQDISDAICQPTDLLTAADVEQLVNDIDIWATGMEQQLSAQLEGYSSETRDAMMSQGELHVANIQLAILEDMSDRLTARNAAEQAAGEYHQNWVNGLDTLANSFTADVITQYNGYRRMSLQDMDQWSQKLDQWLSLQQESYNSGLTEQVDASMAGVLHKYGNFSADELSDLRSRMWNSVMGFAYRNNAAIDSRLKKVDPRSVFSSGYNRTSYEYGLGESKVTMKLEKVSNGNRDTAWCYVVDADGQKRALSLSFANDSMTKKMLEYFKDSKAYGSTISLEKLNSLMDKVHSKVSSFGNVNWDLLKSKVYGSEEKAKLSNYVVQLSRLFISMKA